MAEKRLSLPEAVEATLRALDPGDVYAAEATAVRMLASALQRKRSDMDLWREFRLALKGLREVSGESGIDESIADLLARLGDSRVG